MDAPLQLLAGQFGEAVTQDVWGDAGERVFENLLPMVRETAERIVLALTRKDIADCNGFASFLQILDDGQSDGANELTFRGLLKPISEE